MNFIQRIRRLAGVVAGLVGAIVAFTAAAPAALAMRVPPPGDTGWVTPPQIRTVVTGGTPGWQIALIAIGAALLASVAAVLLDRARTARRRVTASAA